MSPLEKRVAAAQFTLDGWRDKAFRLGTRDCCRMVAAHLRRMGHWIKLPPSGSYASVRSAQEALKARGWASLIDAMDGFGFERIPPAAAWPGDVVAIPGETALGALTVALGNGRVVGYHQDAKGATVLQPTEYVTAWRVTLT